MRPVQFWGLLLLLGGLVFVASGQAPARHQGIVSVLHAGQAVSLKDTGTGYEIGFLQGASGILGHKVVEVLGDGVVIEDVAGVNQTRIPIYAIKCVVITKAGGAR